MAEAFVSGPDSSNEREEQLHINSECVPSGEQGMISQIVPDHLLFQILEQFPLITKHVTEIEHAAIAVRDREKTNRMDLSVMAQSYLVHLKKRPTKTYEIGEFCPIDAKTPGETTTKVSEESTRILNPILLTFLATALRWNVLLEPHYCSVFILLDSNSTQQSNSAKQPNELNNRFSFSGLPPTTKRMCPMESLTATNYQPRILRPPRKSLQTLSPPMIRRVQAKKKRIRTKLQDA